MLAQCNTTPNETYISLVLETVQIPSILMKMMLEAFKAYILFSFLPRSVSPFESTSKKNNGLTFIWPNILVIRRITNGCKTQAIHPSDENRGQKTQKSYNWLQASICVLFTSRNATFKRAVRETDNVKTGCCY